MSMRFRVFKSLVYIYFFHKTLYVLFRSGSSSITRLSVLMTNRPSVGEHHYLLKNNVVMLFVIMYICILYSIFYIYILYFIFYFLYLYFIFIFYLLYFYILYLYLYFIFHFYILFFLHFSYQ